MLYVNMTNVSKLKQWCSEKGVRISESLKHLDPLELRQLAVSTSLQWWGLCWMTRLDWHAKTITLTSELPTIRLHYHKFIFSYWGGLSKTKASWLFCLIIVPFKATDCKRKGKQWAFPEDPGGWHAYSNRTGDTDARSVRPGLTVHPWDAREHRDAESETVKAVHGFEWLQSTEDFAFQQSVTVRQYLVAAQQYACMCYM